MPDFADASVSEDVWPQIPQMLLNRSWVGVSRPTEQVHNLREFAKFAAKVLISYETKLPAVRP
jgi:hypothetical protein